MSLFIQMLLIESEARVFRSFPLPDNCITNELTFSWCEKLKCSGFNAQRRDDLLHTRAEAITLAAENPQKTIPGSAVVLLLLVENHEMYINSELYIAIPGSRTSLSFSLPLSFPHSSPSLIHPDSISMETRQTFEKRTHAFNLFRYGPICACSNNFFSIERDGWPNS